MESNITNLISIIIPVYNVEQYLNQCIDSIVNQTYKNLEIILVDDGSTDNSSRICDEYALQDKRIKVIHKENGGVSSARNFGLNIAKGEYIGFVDSDDFIERDMYEILIKTLISTNSQIVSCSINNNKYVIKQNETFNKKEIFRKIKKLPCSVWNKLFSRVVLNEILFREDIFIGEDLLFVFQAFTKANQITFIKDNKYHYRCEYNNLKKSFNEKNMSVFETTDIIYKYSIDNKITNLQNLIKLHEVYHSAIFLYQIMKSNFNSAKTIEILQDKIRKGITLYLFSNYKFSNKLFTLCIYTNFKFVRFIYDLFKKFMNIF